MIVKTLTHAALAAFLALGASLAPAAFTPTLAVTAAAQDWQPGDLVKMPDGRRGVIDNTGSVVWNDQRGVHGWQSAPKVDDVLADGGQLVHIRHLGE
jgi:hypothetical protein